MAFFFWPENLNARKELRPNNIIHSTADQTEALELANLIIPLLCQSVKRKCAGSGRQLHPLKPKDWMRGNKKKKIQIKQNRLYTLLSISIESP